ncbi:hypothetical protein NPIL_169651 [Nephila pilipes]|uniref:Uncharacterized protein n=1 Tax=Nephila pilipes TaxID=299642 RepID=A0A8X6IM95_NEPPI|nr:hypothetical protein NPIL_169651 [Nephila pilipes]
MKLTPLLWGTTRGVVSSPNERARLCGGGLQRRTVRQGALLISGTLRPMRKKLRGGVAKGGMCVQTILRDPINTRPPTPRGRKEQDIKKMKKRKNTKKRKRPVEKCLPIKKGQSPTGSILIFLYIAMKTHALIGMAIDYSPPPSTNVSSFLPSPKERQKLGGGLCFF